MLLNRVKRAGFTVVELIFVILGLIAAGALTLTVLALILWACGAFK